MCRLSKYCEFNDFHDWVVFRMNWDFFIALPIQLKICNLILFLPGKIFITGKEVSSEVLHSQMCPSGIRCVYCPGLQSLFLFFHTDVSCFF